MFDGSDNHRGVYSYTDVRRWIEMSLNSLLCNRFDQGGKGYVTVKDIVYALGVVAVSVLCGILYSYGGYSMYLLISTGDHSGDVGIFVLVAISVFMVISISVLMAVAAVLLVEGIDVIVKIAAIRVVKKCERKKDKD